MNKNDNLELIEKFGDNLQLEFGAEFGFYAKQLSKEQISRFCEHLNSLPWIQNKEYFFSSKYYYKDDSFAIFVRSNVKPDFFIPIKLLDHSIYFVAKEIQWLEIEDKLFKLVTRQWQHYLAKHVTGYKRHFNNMVILSRDRSQLLMKN